MRTTDEDVLVVDLLGGIGDLLMVLPAVHALARRPGARVRVLTHEPGAELLHADPSVAEVLVDRQDGPRSARAAVVAALHTAVPDVAVTTTRYDGIPDLLEQARCAVTDLWRTPPADDEVGQRYLRILHEEGLVDDDALTERPQVVLTEHERDRGRALLGRLPADHAARPVLLVPQAGMRVKEWPARAWGRLEALLADAGYAVLTVGTGPGVRLPTLSLRDLAAVQAAIGEAGGVAVGGDTGPLRLAAAVGVPTVALFGPTWAPRYRIPGGRFVQGIPECPHRRPTSITDQVCWWDACCPLAPGQGPACMADLAPDRVLREVEDIARPVC